MEITIAIAAGSLRSRCTTLGAADADVETTADDVLYVELLAEADVVTSVVDNLLYLLMWPLFFCSCCSLLLF